MKEPERAQWKIAEWCEALGKSQAWYFSLEDCYKPRSVKIGKSRHIIEEPRRWLLRMERRGGVPSRTQRVAA